MKGLLQKQAAERVGRVLSGKWRLEALLGVGGMGAVYRATHLRNGVEVAIKILNFGVGEGERKRFVREGYAANLVDHPGVVSVLDDGDDGDGDGGLYLVMELLTGKSLKQVWQDHDLAIPWGELHPIVGEVLGILVAAHAKGVVHRDIKPDNVFVESSGAVRLIDFGIARVHDRSGDELTSTSATLGTPAYMSPEQARSRWDEVDARSDLFSLGATVFRLLSGHGIHERDGVGQLLVAIATEQAPSIRASMPELPEPIARVVDRALAFDRADRFQSAAEMLSAWTDAGAGAGAAPSPPRPRVGATRTAPSTETIENATNVASPPRERGSPVRQRASTPADETTSTVDSTRVDPSAEPLTRAALQELARERGPVSVTLAAVPVRRSRALPALLGLAAVAGATTIAVVAMTATNAPRNPGARAASAATSASSTTSNRAFPGANATVEDVGECADSERCGAPRTWSCKDIWPLAMRDGVPTPSEKLCEPGTPFLVAPAESGDDYCGLPVRVCGADGKCKEIRAADVGRSTSAWGASPELLHDLGIARATPPTCDAASRVSRVLVTTGSWNATRAAPKTVVVEPGQTVEVKFEPARIGDHAVDVALAAEVAGAKATFCWAADSSPNLDCWVDDDATTKWRRRLLWSGSTDVRYAVRFRAPESARAEFRHREYLAFER